jgi:hypothetical protein
LFKQASPPKTHINPPTALAKKEHHHGNVHRFHLSFVSPGHGSFSANTTYLCFSFPFNSPFRSFLLSFSFRMKENGIWAWLVGLEPD